jgi:hypothetical protein
LIGRPAASLADFRIEATGTRIFSVMITGATSDAHGAFIVEFEESYAQRTLPSIAVQFKIFNGGAGSWPAPSDRCSGTWTSASAGSSSTFTSARTSRWKRAGRAVASATACFARGGLQDALVRAFDKDLRRRLLGEASTERRMGPT